MVGTRCEGGGGSLRGSPPLSLRDISPQRGERIWEGIDGSAPDLFRGLLWAAAERVPE